MTRRAFILIPALVALVSAAVYSQTPLPNPTPREPSWAFQVIEAQLPAESPEPKTIPGSTRKYTPKEIDDLYNPPDWLPESHPPAPGVVAKGRPGASPVMACGACHLMSGLGHPESADLTGYTAAYLIQQMNDFRSGARQDFARRMDGFAKGMTDTEIREAAEYFAALPRVRFVRVVEAKMVPRTFVGQGRMRFIDPKQKGEEPIGNRIITLPENQELARLRDPRSGFVAYVPPGSIARGKALAETGGGGKTIACTICHGEGLKGLGNVPRLAGVHPIYLVRQLIHFKEGTRKGPDAALMMKPVMPLNERDMIDLAAYAGSLNPQ
jgi:cytochrome c553